MNPISILLDLAIYVITVFIILKSTGRTRDLGIGFLLSRLSFLLVFVIFLLQLVKPMYIYYVIGGTVGIFVIITLALFPIKKSLVARNYVVITICSLLFNKIALWGALIWLLLDFYNHIHNKKDKSDNIKGGIK